MSTVVDVCSANRRENEGQGVRNGIAQQPGQFYGGISSSRNIWGNPKNPNPNSVFFVNANPGGMPINLDGNTNVNSSAASFSSSSGSFGDARFDAGFPGLSRTDSGKKNTFNSSSAMGDGINFNANGNVDSFASAPFSTSRASFSFASNNVLNSPSKDTAGPFQAEASTSAQRSRPFAAQRVRLVKVRRNLNSSKGKSAAFTGKVFDGENSLGVEKRGYNPFRSNSNSGSDQTGYCFKHDMNQSSSTSASFSNVFGENIDNQGFKSLQGDHPKPFANNDAAKPAAFTGKLFDGENSSGFEKSGYNPFRANSNSGSNQTGYCFKRDLNQSSSTSSSFSNVFGVNIGNQGFKTVQDNHPKPFAKNDSGKPAAFTGKLFDGGESSSGFEKLGYNPFRSNSNSGSNQTGYCFKRDLNQSSSTYVSFSNVFGENIGNQGCKSVQDDHPKPFTKNDSAKQNDDEELHNRIREWNPFIGTSRSGSGVAANSYFKTNEDRGSSFTFRGSMEDSLASKMNSGNDVNVAVGGSVSGWPGAVNVGSTVDEVNHASKSSDSMVWNEQRVTKPSEMNSGSVKGHLYCPEDAAQGPFFFTTASKPEFSVRSIHKQDLRTGGCDGPFASETFNSDTNGLKKNIDVKIENPLTNPISGSFSQGACTFDETFAAEKLPSLPAFAGSAANSSVGLMTGCPIPSTFIFNAGGKFECGSRKAASHLDEPCSLSEGSASASAAHVFVSGSTEETANKVHPLSSTGETAAVPTNWETPCCEGKSSRKDSSWPAMGSLFASLNQIFEFSASKESSKSHSTRKKKEISQLPTSIQRKLGRRSALKSKRHMPCSTSAKHAEGGSPMDFSPYNESASKDESPFGNHNKPDLGQSSEAWETPVQYNVQTSYNLHESLFMEAKVEELRAAAVNLYIGTDKEISAKSHHQEKPSKGGENLSWQRSNSDYEAESFIPDRCNTSKGLSTEEQISIPSSESECLNSKMEKVRIDDHGAKAEAEESSQSKQFTFACSSGDAKAEEISHSKQFTFAFSSDSVKADVKADVKAEENSQSKQFTFVSPSPNSTPSVSRRHARRSHRPKIGENINASSCDIKVDLSPFTTQAFVFQRDGMQRDILSSKGDKFQGTKQKDEEDHRGDTFSELFSSMAKHKEESGATVISSVGKSAAAEQACERWRLRGNQAYANGDFPKAEDYYSRGASIVSPNETSESCIRASMLCYSNRAATRMAVGRMREALADCKRAMAIDPNFLRVQIRAASCHLSLGESEAAVAMYKGCLRSVKDMMDLKIAAEASEGVRKAQQGWEYTDRAAELLDTRNPGDATNALRGVNEALSISPHSERLHELKALALLILRKYEEVIQVCEQSLDSAERNHCFANNDSQVCNNDSSESLGQFPYKLWRWRMCAKAHFYLGRLEEALDLLLKSEEVNSAVEKYGKESMESLTSFMVTIRDLLRHKAAGNKAFQEGKHAEAVEHYTAALACNGESRPFTAVCFCNRAAASQALGHIADAIADCSRAIALDPNYPKAISRRATLHEIVRDYGQAYVDLQKLTNLLESQQRNKASQPGRMGSSSTSTQELRQACDRLAKADEEMKKENPLDHYLILGVEASSTAAEIKKAYRKAALRHHPDKAGQFSGRSDSGDDGYWNEVGDEVRRDAERLFKMIGESYAILSDPGKRARYDAEEEVRKLRTRGNGSGSETLSETYYYQYEKGSRRQRDRWDSWTPFQRWQNGPDAAQPDTFARRGSNNSRSSDGSRWNDWDYF